MNNDLLLCKGKLESEYNCWVVGYYRETKKCEHIVYTKTGLEFIVDPDTVCQCTGRKDITGKLIYTGDWWHEEDTDGHWIYIVDYSTDELGFVANVHCGISLSNYDTYLQYESCLNEHVWGKNNITIEGNIHDNTIKKG